jgi:hypothetical protein
MAVLLLVLVSVGHVNLTFLGDLTSKCRKEKGLEKLVNSVTLLFSCRGRERGRESK